MATASLRAYGAQEAFKAESYRRIDRYTRCAITHNNLNRYVRRRYSTQAGAYDLGSWVTVRVDLIGTMFSTSLAIYLTYFNRLSASNTGFSLTMAGT